MIGYESLRTGAAWIDLSARGKIRVEGEDRARLLHAMTTNHVTQLSAGHGAYLFFLNAQGRILADAYLYAFGDHLFLDTEPETRHKVMEHLDKYIIADDVTLADETERWLAVGIEGPAAADALRKLGAPRPQGRNEIATWGEGFVANVQSAAISGFRIFLPAAQRDGFFQQLADKETEQADAEAARVVRLEHGIPRYGDDISERYLVQETQQLHAVHFNKGCYLGQEIVERVRSRAQVHRFLTPVRIAGREAVAPGAKLLAGNQPAGELTSAVFSPAEQQLVGLAYIRSEALQNRSELTLSGEEAPVVVRAMEPAGAADTR